MRFEERPLKHLLLERSKKDQARNLLKPIFRRGKMSQEEAISIMMKRLDIANNTAITYYHMIAKEFGIDHNDMKSNDGNDESSTKEVDKTNDEETDGFDKAGDYEVDENGNIVIDSDDLEDGEFVKKDNPDRMGVIRTIKGAKLVYKRENAQGLYDELWIYNIYTTLSKEIDIKQDILAGTDIPPKSTKSPDGSQRYTITTIGNAQLLHIINLTH